jgi:hypothetical protein
MFPKTSPCSVPEDKIESFHLLELFWRRFGPTLGSVLVRVIAVDGLVPANDPSAGRDRYARGDIRSMEFQPSVVWGLSSNLCDGTAET